MDFDASVRCYGKFFELMWGALPGIRRNPRITSALLGTSGLPPNNYHKIIEALSPSTLPLIFPKKMRGNSGEFSPREPDRIYISTRHLEEFQYDWADPAAQTFMVANLLHELVHFLDFNADGELLDAVYNKRYDEVTYRDKDGEGAQMDQGKIFEMLAFGEKVQEWKPISK